MALLGHRRVTKQRAFTLVELLSVLFVMTCMFIMVTLYAQPRGCRCSSRVKCVNNLKNVGLAYRIYATDNGDLFPWESRSPSAPATNYPALFYYVAVSNEISTPAIVVCPSDSRKPATNWTSMRRQNVSYFLNIDASETQPSVFLAGDRNLMTDSVRFTPPRAKIPPSAQLSWTSAQHTNQGNMCMVDGSVQQLSNARLREEWQVMTNEYMNQAVTVLFP